MDYQIPEVPFQKYRFTVAATQRSFLPAYKGSMLRGAFGQQLKKTTCVFPQNAECKTCSLHAACAYTCLFESAIEKEPPPFLHGLDTAPRPYIFFCENYNETLQSGETFTFDFTLIGTACVFFREAILAIMQTATAGFSVRRHPFEIVKIECLESVPAASSAWHTLYDGKIMSNLQPKIIPYVPMEKLPNPLRMDFVTPLRMKIKGHLATRVTFRQLVFQMLRRLLELGYFYAPDQRIDWEFNALLKMADAVYVIDEDFKWADWARFSDRQHREVQMGGFQGHMALEGDLEPYQDLINAAHWFHVGKGTVMGLGKFVVTNHK